MKYRVDLLVEAKLVLFQLNGVVAVLLDLLSLLVRRRRAVGLQRHVYVLDAELADLRDLALEAERRRLRLGRARVLPVFGLVRRARRRAELVHLLKVRMRLVLELQTLDLLLECEYVRRGRRPLDVERRLSLVEQRLFAQRAATQRREVV